MVTLVRAIEALQVVNAWSPLAASSMKKIWVPWAVACGGRRRAGYRVGLHQLQGMGPKRPELYTFDSSFGLFTRFRRK